MYFSIQKEKKKKKKQQGFSPRKTNENKDVFNKIVVGTIFVAQTQYVKGYKPSEPSTINL